METTNFSQVPLDIFTEYIKDQKCRIAQRYNSKMKECISFKSYSKKQQDITISSTLVDACEYVQKTPLERCIGDKSKDTSKLDFNLVSSTDPTKTDVTWKSSICKYLTKSIIDKADHPDKIWNSSNTVDTLLQDESNHHIKLYPGSICTEDTMITRGRSRTRK